MKKLIALFAALLLAGASFAQTKVDAKKLAKTLESNKIDSAVFVSELDLSGLKVADDGKISLPLFAKSKVGLVAGMDMTNITERIEYANKKSFTVTFEAKDLASKKYALTNIEGIESVAECAVRLRSQNLAKLPVQIVNLDATGLLATEAAWLPGQARDKLKSNLQEYLGMNAVVNAKSEPELKKVFAQAEGAASDKIVSEFAKATDAKFALFAKAKKTAKGYSISADFMDLATGEKLASVSSNEYTKSDYLCGPTGAADQITLAIAKKLDIKMSDLNKSLLASGSANFNVDQQLALAEQNEAQYKKLAAQLDSELSKLGSANDFATVENKRKIEAQKALLIEKQSAERKRQEY
ncbi:MAG: hypothetical protein II814_09775, partial [Treponema sp.]|nr:hypothetical protein [Treponema sp.]